MSTKRNLNIDLNRIDDLLPQTQCGLCEYAGCRPYADAMMNDGERIDRCLPGGVTTLKQLGELLQQDPTPYFADMEKKQKPPLTVVIREHECIGCTKCIQACPVDAILGASKKMHTVISDACTGCELCIEPCPVDCIDIIPIQNLIPTPQQSKQRYEKRNARLARDQQERQQKHARAKQTTHSQQDTIEARKLAIQAAINRSKTKKAKTLENIAS